MDGCNDRRRAEQLLATLRTLPWRQQAVFLALLEEDISYATLAAKFKTDVADIERDFVCALIALGAAADG